MTIAVTPPPKDSEQYATRADLERLLARLDEVFLAQQNSNGKPKPKAKKRKKQQDPRAHFKARVLSVLLEHLAASSPGFARLKPGESQTMGKQVFATTRQIVEWLRTTDKGEARFRPEEDAATHGWSIADERDPDIVLRSVINSVSWTPGDTDRPFYGLFRLTRGVYLIGETAKDLLTSDFVPGLGASVTLAQGHKTGLKL